MKRYLDACRGVGEEGSRKERLARRGKETEYRKNYITGCGHVIDIAGTGGNVMSLTIALQQINALSIECYQASFKVQSFDQLTRGLVPACFAVKADASSSLGFETIGRDDSGAAIY